MGVDIVSESRFFELYDEGEGYLLTARGTKLPSVDEDGEDTTQLYQCRARLSETLYSFNIKVRIVPM